MQVTMNKSSDVLFNLLTQAFELMGGVPNELVTDNMKTVMDPTKNRTYKWSNKS